MADDRLPTWLYLEGHLKTLDQQAVYYYIHQRGASASGLILLKINPLDGTALLLTQQRDLDGVMGWMRLMKGEAVPDAEADAYIRRAMDRDPDLWVIEIEDKNKKNPFEGKVF